MSMSDRDGFIWYDGKLVPWRNATTHVLTHSLHYGLSVFEGVRAYKTVKGTAIFRLREHTDRLFNSAHIYMMKIPYTREQIMEAQKEVVRANKLSECYLRPIAFYGSEKMGVSPKGAQVHVAIAAWPWGAYLGADGLEKGIRVKTSSFARHHVNVSMCRAKYSGTYANSILANAEALDHGPRLGGGGEPGDVARTHVRIEVGELALRFDDDAAPAAQAHFEQASATDPLDPLARLRPRVSETLGRFLLEIVRQHVLIPAGLDMEDRANAKQKILGLVDLPQVRGEFLHHAAQLLQPRVQVLPLGGVHLHERQPHAHSWLRERHAGLPRESSLAVRHHHHVQSAVRADHPMAWDDDRQRISPIRQSHGAACLGPSNRAGDRGVRLGRTERNSPQSLPDDTLKLGPHKFERQVELPKFSVEVVPELPGGPAQHHP